MKFFKNFLIVFSILIPGITFSASTVNINSDQVFQAFKSYKIVEPSVTVPTVVEVPFSQGSYSGFAVYNMNTKDFEPYLYSVNQDETKVRLTALGEIGLPYSMNDVDYSTYFEFPVHGDVSFSSTINFDFEKPITAEYLNFTLDNNVALPQSISISAEVVNKDRVILAPIHPTSGNVLFPKTTSNKWQVQFSYVQPLRISEIKFNDLSNTIVRSGLRFLATPKQSYQVYFDSDRYVESSNKEPGDLSADEGVVRLPDNMSVSNTKYRPMDSDQDSIPDFSDNCVSVANNDQVDANANGRGDACEDYDRDGVLNFKDNCQDTPNFAQQDTDTDDIGDICDSLDNRVTERMPWLPWAGIGFASVIILGLFMVVLSHKRV